MLKNSLFQFSLSFSFSTAVLFLFLFSAFFCFGAAPVFLFLPTFLFFSVHVCPFSQPKNILFSPKQFSLQPKNIFFSPNVFAQTFFSPNVFASAQNLFQFSPHHCFSLFFFCFGRFSFCWFCFQCTFSFCSVPPFLLSFSVPHSLFLANFQGQKFSL